MAGDRRFRIGGAVVVALVAVAASVAGIGNDFVYDDIPLIRDNDRVQSVAHWRDVIRKPYWPPPYVEQLYRPLTVLLLVPQWLAGHGSPMVFRLVSYALYALSAVAVWRLASLFLTREVATGVGVLFAAHPVHVEAVALGVNQAELLLGILACESVRRYIRKRRSDGLSVKDWGLIALMYAAASLTKESGFILPGLFVAAELTGLDQRTWRQRAAVLWPGYGLLVLIAGALLLQRASVLPGGPVTVVPGETIAGLGLPDRAMTMLAVVPTWFQRFFWPARLQVDYMPPAATTPGAAHLLGLLLIGLTAAALYVARNRAPAIVLGITWCVIALLPVSNIIPSGVGVAERTLFVPSIGVVLAAGGAADLVLRHRPTPLVKRGLIVACALLGVLGIVRSTSRHLVWNSDHIRVVR